jgi:hypothetical protein
MIESAILVNVLRTPSAASLSALQAAVLAVEHGSGPGPQLDAARLALAIADDFHAYLAALEGRVEARSYAELASRMDIAAVGGVVLENVLDAGERLTERILIGGLSEALMMLASRQYVKAFRRELVALYREVAWKLRAHFWRLAARGRPDVDAGERTLQVDLLLAPIASDATDDTVRSVLIGLLFQIVLLATAAPLVERGRD